MIDVHLKLNQVLYLPSITVAPVVVIGGITLVLGGIVGILAVGNKVVLGATLAVVGEVGMTTNSQL